MGIKNLTQRQRLTDRAEMNAAPDGDDVLHIVDVSDLTDSLEGTSKKISVNNLLAGVNVQASTDNIIKYYDSTAYSLTSMVAELNALNPPLEITANEIYRFKLSTGEVYELKDKGKGIYGLNNLQVVEDDFELSFRAATETRGIISDTNAILKSDNLKILFSTNPITRADLTLKTQANENYDANHFTKLVGNQFGFSITPEAGVTVKTDLTLTGSGSYSINSNQSFDLIKLGTDLWYLGSGVTQPPSGIITTTTNITSTTLTDAGSAQDGKVIGIANGVNVINYTISGAMTASFVLLGTGAVTFIQGSGRTLVLKSSTATLTGTGSTASVVSFGTIDYLYINNI